MKIVDIVGGLGNQMFQYALAIVLEKRFGEPVYVDVSTFETYKVHNGLELERVFGLKLNKATWWQITRLAYYSRNYKLNRLMRKILPRRKTMCFEFPLEKFDEHKLYTSDSMYYEGYWQHARYFDEYAEDVKRTFTFAGELLGRSADFRNVIELSNSVSIHIRRGDYLQEKNYCGLCDENYYKAAVEHICKHVDNPHFFIFSNDVEWCKEHIVPMLEEYDIVDCHSGQDSYKDMWLMSLCKHMILANSSFSWWAAYLNKNKGIVIAPKVWTRNKKTYNRQLSEWILM